MKIAFEQDAASATLRVEGRVDTNTAPELQERILRTFQDAQILVLDFAGVDYISSAGLRALLIGQKTAAAKRGSMTLLRLQAPVAEVLRLSGMDHVLQLG